MIKNLHCLLLIFFVNFSYADDFQGEVKEWLKNILCSEMYKETSDTLSIGDEIGKIFTCLIKTRNGRSLLERLSDLSQKINFKLNFLPGIRTALLPRLVDGNFVIWLKEKESFERIIAIKRSETTFDFFKVTIPKFIAVAHELLHYLQRLEWLYELKIKNGSTPTYNNQQFLRAHRTVLKFSSNVCELFGNKSEEAYDEISTIVGHLYKTDEDFIFLSETVFLQEYLKTSNCFLCYGHSTRFNTKLSTLEIIEEIIDLDGIRGRIAEYYRR